MYNMFAVVTRIFAETCDFIAHKCFEHNMKSFMKVRIIDII